MPAATCPEDYDVGPKDIPLVEKDTANDRSCNSGSLTEDGGEPTLEEMTSLRRIGDTIPLSAWLVAIVELAERFTFYGLTGPFQNYMQNERGGLNPGALGLGQPKATALSYFFQFWTYVTPLFGAIVADAWLGRYNTIALFAFIYICGLLILFCTSLPYPLEHGAGFGGLITAMIVLGIGTGGIKSNVSPLIAEQYTVTKPRIRTLKSGERVIVDPGITIQSIYNIFYCCINIGSLSAIATVWIEKKVDFWAAYLLPLCFFFIGLSVLFIGRKRYVVRPPSGSVLIDGCKALWIAMKARGNMDAAKPSYQTEHGGVVTVPWNDSFIDELKRALVASKVFLFFPIYWLVYGQMITNFVSMAGTMETHGIPNDLLFNLDPIAIIIFIPIVERGLYPFLRKIRVPFKPITRITVGFILAACSMAYAAFVQHIIYSSPPCYNFPLAPTCQNGEVPNKVHVAIQTPAYVLIGLSEIFASVTGLEYAFTKAPASMKSFIMSIFLFQNAIGSALGIALSPTSQNPKLVIMYSSLAGSTFMAGCLFWLCFNKYNKTEEEMNRIGADNDDFKPKEVTEAKPVVGKSTSDKSEVV